MRTDLHKTYEKCLHVVVTFVTSVKVNILVMNGTRFLAFRRDMLFVSVASM